MAARHNDRLMDIQFMELAIEEAKQSTGKVTDPKVGAVLVKNRKQIGTAHRGADDHAEFTLLHKRLRSTAVTRGTTLYTTLEPCTARGHEKQPCASWIVSKGVRRVVVGILDPNPNICGRGYWQLMQAGIEVDFFPSNLAKQIHEINQEFIIQHLEGAREAPIFASEIQRRKNNIIQPYIGLGWDHALTIQQAPNIREGWFLREIEFRLNEAGFEMPREHNSHYEKYFQEFSEEKRFSEDGDKFMLVKNPVVFTDTPAVVLDLKLTKYSHVCYCRDRIATNVSEKKLLIEDFLRGSLQANFAHTLSLNMVVVTSDRKILLTHRSPKVMFDPRTWSASIEEQLSREDFHRDGSINTAFAWASRALEEELGVTRDHYHPDNLRCLSIFLEANSLNISLCGYTELRLDSVNLGRLIKGIPRRDYEFTDYTFIDLDKKSLLQELFLSKYPFHPTTGYRLLYAFIKNFGIPSDQETYEAALR